MNHFKNSIKFFVVLTIFTGILYPLLITIIAQLFFPYQANGSLLKSEGKVIGSILIAQGTYADQYFWSRPSAIDYNPIKPSGGSNLGPTSLTLKKIVEERKQKVGFLAPAELLYASASGLDPHISLETAYFQIPRVAKARLIIESELKELVDSLAEGKILNFGPAWYINVLILNHALDMRGTP